LILQPYQILVEKKFNEAVSFFNKCQFDTSLLVVAQIEHTVPDPVLLGRLVYFKNVILAYSAWEKFNHQEALDKLNGVKLPDFDANKAFLGKLCHAKVKERYYIADLINNAKRRGDIERKYDDAVARLYRTMELIAQYKLKEHGIEDTSNVPVDKIPPALAQGSKTTSGKIKIGLEKAYLFLDAKGDDLGREFVNDNRLKGLLHKRNSSILAHGIEPVGEEVYRQLSEKIFVFASLIIEDFNRLLSESTFREWPS